MYWKLSTLLMTGKPCSQQGVFCYAGNRIYPHRYIAIQLQSQLTIFGLASEYAISFLSLISNSNGLTLHGIPALHKALDVVGNAPAALLLREEFIDILSVKEASHCNFWRVVKKSKPIITNPNSVSIPMALQFFYVGNLLDDVGTFH